VLCDAERAVLAFDPRAYRAYSAAVKEEFDSQDPRTVLEARMSVLRRWLAKDRLFLTSATASWEAAARNNVEAELTRAVVELAQLDAAQEAGHRPSFS
jgi:predicted metal-dependent HD superfamily phosphohydrolase